MTARVVEFKTDHRGPKAMEIFTREILGTNKGNIILVIFHDPECGPSRNFLQRGQYMPSVVEEAGDEVIVCKVNLLEGGNVDIADAYEILVAPTTAFFRYGRFLRRVTGAEKAPIIMRVLGECLRVRC